MTYSLVLHVYYMLINYINEFLYPITLSCVSIMLLITVGGIITGAMSDFLNARAISSVIMMYLAVPTVS